MCLNLLSCTDEMNNKLPLLIVMLLFLTGCATYNTATGRNEVILISTSQEVAMGRDINKQICSQNKIITSGAEFDRLNSIAQRIVRVSDRQDFQYHFALIDKDEMNAFTVPGGYIYFYTGLLRKLPSDDAVAAVLAHEVGHGAAKHVVKKFQAAMGYNVTKNVVMNVISWKYPQMGYAKNIASLGADSLVQLAMSAYSRQDEYEADRLGIKYLYLAGFDLNGMIKTFEVLKEVDKKGGAIPSILRTHPLAQDRIEAAKKDIEAVKQKY